MEESEEADVMIVAKLAKIKFLRSTKNELLQKKSMKDDKTKRSG